MKKLILSIFCLFHIGIGYAQDVWPSHKVTDINGKIRDLKSYAPDSGVVLFVFWKTCCPNNVTMINELQEVWLDYNDTDKPVKIVLVSVDDQRSVSRVKPIVSTNGWEFDVIIDKNMDMARMYHINIPPQWIVCDTEGNIIYRSKITNGYLGSGMYFEEIVQLIQK